MKFFLALTIFLTSLNAIASLWDLADLENKMSSTQLKKMKLHPNREFLFKDKIMFENKLGVNSSIVYVAFLGPDDSFIYYCSGALMSPRLVLTSKHCLKKKETKHIVVLTDKYLLEEIGEEIVSHSYVSSITEDCPESGWCKDSPEALHVEFDVSDYIKDFTQDDLVLLNLKTDLDSPDGYFELVSDQENLKDQKMQMGGFPSFAGTLANKIVKYISEPVCDFIGEFEKIYVTNCIPAAGISGGPLFYQQKGKQFLVGIVSSPIGPEFTETSPIPYSGTRTSDPLSLPAILKALSTQE